MPGERRLLLLAIRNTSKGWYKVVNVICVMPVLDTVLNWWLEISIRALHLRYSLEINARRNRED